LTFETELTEEEFEQLITC